MRLAYRVEHNIHVLSNQHITLKICAGKLIHFRHYNNFVDINDLSCKIASKCYVIDYLLQLLFMAAEFFLW